MNVYYYNIIEEVSCNSTVTFEMLCDKHTITQSLVAHTVDAFLNLNYLLVILSERQRNYVCFCVSPVLLQSNTIPTYIDLCKPTLFKIVFQKS